MQIGSKACFCSESRRHKPCLDVLIAKVLAMTAVRLHTYPSPEIRAIRGPHQHEAVQVDDEMNMSNENERFISLQLETFFKIFFIYQPLGLLLLNNFCKCISFTGICCVVIRAAREKE